MGYLENIEIPKFEEQLEVFALIESPNRAINVYNPSVNQLNNKTLINNNKKRDNRRHTALDLGRY